jgi:hypothetical protein
MRRLYLDHVSSSRLAAHSCSVPVLAIDAGDELCAAINSATKRGRRDGEQQQPRHRLLGWGAKGR